MSYLHYKDPGSSFKNHETARDIFKIFMIAIAIIYCLLLCYYCINICRVFVSRLWRHKIFFIVSVYFFFAIMIFIFAGAIKVYSKNGEMYLLFLLTTNMYVYYMLYMYSPCNQGLQELNKKSKASEYEKFQDVLEDQPYDIKFDIEQNNNNNNNNGLESCKVNQNDEFENDKELVEALELTEKSEEFQMQ